MTAVSGVSTASGFPLEGDKQPARVFDFLRLNTKKKRKVPKKL
jgi:hypothetical protein